MINNQDYSINYTNLERRETILIAPSCRIIFYGETIIHKFTLDRVLCLLLSTAELLEAKGNHDPYLRWTSVGELISHVICMYML